MTVALRFALSRAPRRKSERADDPPGTRDVLPFVAARILDLAGSGPSYSPGSSAPASRSSCSRSPSGTPGRRAPGRVGTSPLFSVVIALVFLDEPSTPRSARRRSDRPRRCPPRRRARPAAHFKRPASPSPLATVVFAVRDNLVRWLSTDTAVSPRWRPRRPLGPGPLVALYVLGARGRATAPAAPGIRPGGDPLRPLVRCLFEGYYRGRVTVVSPLVATESSGASCSRRCSCAGRARRPAPPGGRGPGRRGRRTDRRLPLTG